MQTGVPENNTTNASTGSICGAWVICHLQTHRLGDYQGPLMGGPNVAHVNFEEILSSL